MLTHACLPAAGRAAVPAGRERSEAHVCESARDAGLVGVVRGLVGAIEALNDGNAYRVKDARRALAALASASEDERAAAVARIRELFEENVTDDASENRRIRSGLLAYLLPDQPDAAEGVIARAIDPAIKVAWSERHAVYTPLAWVRDLALLDRAIEAIDPYDLGHSFDPFTTVLVHGEAGVARVARVFERARTKDANVPDDAQERLLAAIAAAPTEAAFRVVLEHGELRIGVENVAVGCAEAPAVAMRAALPVAVRSPRPSLALGLERLGADRGRRTDRHRRPGADGGHPRRALGGRRLQRHLRGLGGESRDLLGRDRRSADRAGRSPRDRDRSRSPLPDP